MKKFIYLSVKVFTLLLCVNLLYGIVLIKTDWNVKSTVNFFHGNQKNIDILILGNSLGMDGIDAGLISNETGLNCYNASIEGGSLNDALYRFQFALENNDISTVIIASNINYASDCGDKHLVTKGFCESSFIFQNHLTKYRSFHIGVIKKIISAKHRKSQIVKGQLRYEYSYTDNSELKYDTTECDLELLSCYESIANLAEMNSVDLFFVNMPLVKEQRQILKRASPSLKIINLNGPAIENVISAKEHFGSVNHLNKHGAKILTKKLLQVSEGFYQ